MYGLKKELLKLEKQFNNIKVPVFLIHGKKDKIVPYEDSLWLLEKLRSISVEAHLKTYESAGHFIIWKQHEAVVQDLLEQL